MSSHTKPGAGSPRNPDRKSGGDRRVAGSDSPAGGTENNASRAYITTPNGTRIETWPALKPKRKVDPDGWTAVVIAVRQSEKQALRAWLKAKRLKWVFFRRMMLRKMELNPVGK